MHAVVIVRRMRIGQVGFGHSHFAATTFMPPMYDCSTSAPRLNRRLLIGLHHAISARPTADAGAVEVWTATWRP